MRGVPSFLHSGGSQARNRFAIRPENRGQVANHEHLRRAGHRKVGADDHAAGVVERDPSDSPSGDAATPAAQITVRVGIRPPRCMKAMHSPIIGPASISRRPISTSSSLRSSSVERRSAPARAAPSRYEQRAACLVDFKVTMEHHVIPCFYLTGFRDPTLDRRMGPQVWVADLKSRTVKRQSPKGVTTITDYYAISNSSGRRLSQIVEERVLARIESITAQLVARLRDGNFRLTDSERSDLANFMARNSLEESAGMVGESIMRVAANHPAYFARMMREANPHRQFSDEELERERMVTLQLDAFQYRGSPELSLEFMLSIAGALSPVFFGMRWVYAIAPVGRHFITGDGPVFWYDATAPAPGANGLRSLNTTLTFPIGPEIALIGRWESALDSTVYADDRAVNFVNQRVARTSERCIVASRKPDAEAALAHRLEMEARGESVGFRRPNVRIIESPNTDAS
jgi:hypothetical protein